MDRKSRRATARSLGLSLDSSEIVGAVTPDGDVLDHSVYAFAEDVEPEGFDGLDAEELAALEQRLEQLEPVRRRASRAARPVV